MNKNIILGSLIAGGLIGAAVIMGFVMSKPDAPQQAAIETEATETTEEVVEEQNTSSTQTNQTAVPAPASQAPAPAAQKVTAPAAPASKPAPVAQAPVPTHAPVPKKAVSQENTSEGSEFCPDRAGGAPQVAFYETKNFYVYICDVDQLYYHGVSKKDGNFINLPAYAEEGTGYVAENGDYTYIINGASLTVMQGDKVLQEERVF